MAARNGRWQPEPVPVILNLPRRSRRSRAAAPPNPGLGWNLGDLLHQERIERTPEAAEPAPSSSSVESVMGSRDSGVEERWRFQAEILRAECNFLRMEREVALRKLERNRAQMEVALKSAMGTLVSGRKKIDGSESVGEALDVGIVELEEKLEELKLGSSSSRRSRSRGSSRKLLRRSCRGNFDRQASVLRRQLEKMKEDTSVKDIKEISMPALEKNDADAELQERAGNATPDSNHSRRFPDDMEKLRRKMLGLSKGMLERMEECSYLLSATTNSSTTSCSGGSSINRSSSRQKVASHNEAADDHPFLHLQQQQQEKLLEEKMGLLSCCNCKEAVGRIMQQVRAESEQWSEMQEMLEQVRVEMEELRSARDHWRRRAISSEINFHSQHTQKLEWKQKAQSSERKVIELQKLVTELQQELQPSRSKLLNSPPSFSSPLHSELPAAADSRRTAKNQQMRSLDSYKEEEKQALTYHLKSQNNLSRRSPLQNIDNISPLLRPRH